MSLLDGKFIVMVFSEERTITQLLCQDADLILFICELLCILVVMPIGSAEAEKSFSCQRQIHSWLRSTMSNERLENLGVLACQGFEVWGRMLSGMKFVYETRSMCVCVCVCVCVCACASMCMLYVYCVCMCMCTILTLPDTTYSLPHLQTKQAKLLSWEKTTFVNSWRAGTISQIVCMLVCTHTHTHIQSRKYIRMMFI